MTEVSAANVNDLDFDRLDIADAHLLALQDPPHLHRDPFDWLLISQAMVEQLTILTADGAFASYAVSVLDTRT
ncbi:MAG: hypothetical protein M3Y19_10295 [Actinomycetota bacterium]|nr:hypothetical protein [Actinomycetota bacterium]